MSAYADSIEDLDVLLTHFYDDIVFIALKNARIPRPELLNMAAIEAFMHPDRFDANRIDALRLELLYLEDNGILFYADKDN